MNIIEVENKHYILATSSLADQRTLVVKQGDTFAIFDYHGDIHQVGFSKQGIFHNGTRHLSRLELNINGIRPLLLSSSPRDDNQMLMVDLTNPALASEENEVILHGSIHILRSKLLWESAYHEKIEFINFGLEPATLTVSVECDADFADIFEVRGSVREQRGTKLKTKQNDESITFSYRGLDNILRQTSVRFTPQPKYFDGKRALFPVNLLPQQEMKLEIGMTFLGNSDNPVLNDFDIARESMNTYMERQAKYSGEIFTSNEQVNDWIMRSKSDLITMTTQTPYGLYPYAGIPWYSTPFGRDGIITALECLWIEPEVAKGVLQYLAHTQAKDFDSFKDAEPGKILHETRGGEMAELGEIPFKLYYGTIDATPLFITLAGAYLERTHDVKTIANIWPCIKLALDWIDLHGDLDGDGFVEYKTKSPKGLTNQGWKDSQDSVFYEDGRLADDPIALCEVQGYVYDAKLSAARIAKVLGQPEMTARLEGEAELLKTRFNEQFWSESKQTYVIALDGKKKPCNVNSSNAGHCLFSGIATPERAAIVAKNLLSQSMFSGWGIRTISTDEIRYNPMSYHNGSVWPHDNALIAMGFARYGLKHECNQVFAGAFDTAEHMENNRLPELFCGFTRQKDKYPTSYPVACSPQAWSVGALFMMLQSCLGLSINAASKTITLNNPVLPYFLQDVTISNLRVNNKVIAFQIRKSKHGVEVTPLTPRPDITIEVKNHEIKEV